MEAIANQQIFLNKFSVDLMIWETNPKKRNKNNVVRFYLSKKNTIKEGDIVVGDFNEYGVSVYEIENIQQTKQGAVAQKNYVTAETKWSQKSPSFFKGKDLEQTNLTFQKLVGI